MGKNEIPIIDVFEKENFKELKRLNLKKNKISKIRVVEKVNFNKLEKLDLRNNDIWDLKILKNVNFKQLKELLFKANFLIDNLNVLEGFQFNQLKILEINNCRADISILARVNFNELEE